MATFNKNFQLMVLGQIISLFGASILRFCISLYILELTGSASIFATIMAVAGIPVIFLSPIGGAIADRASKRDLMVIFDFTSSLITGVFAIALFVGAVPVMWIGVIVTLLSAISILYQPTVQASIPILVDKGDLLKANGIVSSVSAISNLAGPVLGGILYVWVGFEKIIVISSISFFLSAVMEIFIRIPHEKRAWEGSAISMLVSDMKEGLQYILHENRFVAKTMCIACALNIFLTPLYMVGVPYIVKIFFGMPDEYLGFAQGAISLAMIIGAVGIGTLNNRLRIRNIYSLLVITAALLLPMTLSVTAIFPSAMSGYITLTVSAFFIMACITMLNIFIMTAIQKQTPPVLLGKVMAILIAVASCATPIGQVIFGMLFDRFSSNIDAVMASVVVVTMAMALVTKISLQREEG